MKFHDGLVIDTFKYNIRPNFHLPEGASAVIKCTNWRGTTVNDGGITKQALELDIIERDGEKVNSFIVAYDQPCEDIANVIRFAILEKRPYILFRITKEEGSYLIEDKAEDKSAPMPTTQEQGKD